MFLSSFLQILMFLDMKLQNKIKFWPKSKRKFKNSSIRTRTGRPKFDYFSSNFSKNLSISMRYTTLPQEGVSMAELIWANDICNAKFDWFSRKETKSTYEKRPFSTRESRFLIWAFPQIPPPLGNASFDWILLKETKSTYEKQPFSEEKPQDRVNPLFSPNFRNEERKR